MLFGDPFLSMGLGMYGSLVALIEKLKIMEMIYELSVPDKLHLRCQINMG